MRIRFFKLLVGTTCSYLTLSLGFHQDGEAQQFNKDGMAQLINQIGLAEGVIDPNQRSLLSYLPDGSSTAPVDPTCDPKQLDQKIRPNQTTQEKAAIYNEYFNRCDLQLRNGNFTGLLALIRFIQLDYQAGSTRWVKPIRLQHSNGNVSDGYIAIKSDGKKRPFIILKCGLFCEGEIGGSTNNYLISLFDQSPFNILIIGNHTGNNWIMNNRALRFGGFDEALEVLETALWLRESSPYKDLISSLHLAGVSLGGHTALYSTIFNDRYEQSTGQKIYNSVTAICPVVQLKETMEELFKDTSVVGQAAKLLTMSNIKTVYDYVPEAHPILLAQGSSPSGPRLALSMADVSTLYMTLKSPIIGIPVYGVQPIQNRDDFWYYNSFFKVVDRVSTPSLIWASKDDMIVNNPKNAATVQGSDLLSKNPNLGVLNLQYGNHCGFSTVYGVPTVSSVLRSFVLSNSPEMHVEQKTQAFIFGDTTLATREKHVAQKWSVQPSSEDVTLEFRVYKERGINCARYRPNIYTAPARCYRSFYKTYKWNDLALLRNRELPANDVEAQVVTRELNGALKVTMPDGGNINGTNNTPGAVAWQSVD